MGPFKREVPVFCQIMARSAAVACAETPAHSRGPGNIRVRVSFTTGAVRSAILATAGLLVSICCGSAVQQVAAMYIHGVTRTTDECNYP